MDNYVVRVTSDEQFHTVRKFIGKDLLDETHSEFNPFEERTDLDEYFIGYYSDGRTFYGNRLSIKLGEVISYGEWCDQYYSPSLVSIKKDVVPFPRVMEVRDEEGEDWGKQMVYCLDGSTEAYCTCDIKLPRGTRWASVFHYKYVRECVEVVEVSVGEIAKWKKVSVDQVKVVGL